jgi:hypothetical protein
MIGFARLATWSDYLVLTIGLVLVTARRALSLDFGRHVQGAGPFDELTGAVPTFVIRRAPLRSGRIASPNG